MIWEYAKAFLVGGALCALGQVLIDLTRLTPARILTCYVVAGVILGGLGLYQPLVDWAGAGASVPLLGFGNAIAAGMRDAVAEKGLLGGIHRGLHRRGGGRVCRHPLRLSGRPFGETQGEEVKGFCL